MLTAVLVAVDAPHSLAEGASSAKELLRSGAEAFARADWSKAERDWTRAEKLSKGAGDVASQVDAELNLAALQQQGGRFDLAKSTLVAAAELAADANQPAKLLRVENALGVVCTLRRQPEAAERALNHALKLAAGRHDEAAESSVRLNVGNLYAAWSDTRGADAKSAASENYDRAIALARKSGDHLLAAKASANAAIFAARAGDAQKTTSLSVQALDFLKDMPDSPEKAKILVAAAHNATDRRAFDAYQSAFEISAKAGDALTAGYAVGSQARHYERAKRYEEALTLTRRAVKLAQRAQSPDSLYLWEWQTGRLLNALGKTDDAIAAYARARDAIELGHVRSDLALGYGNRGFKASFRNDVGPMYYELADLLLKRADAEESRGDAEAVQRDLADARDTVERLRVGELESYLQDPCVNQAAQRRTDLTRELNKVATGNPAVVYLIPLSDRIEVLLTTRKGMQRFKSTSVGAEQLTSEVREFRRRLETRATGRYLTNAKRLYQWLIKPIEPALDAQGIDTLVFVPDGALRTVPMPALHDGKDFLIAKYAVAVSPGLSLSLGGNDPKQVSASARRVLAGGLSQSEAGFKPLPNVAVELSRIQNLYGATKLLDSDFKLQTFEGELRQRPAGEEYSIVHIASHGVFAADVADTFVLTFNGRMNLQDLQGVLQPAQLRGKPVDLLTLSACQTSAGDDQAALERASLGLGGLAVKAGARSALASLWCAHDEATGELVTKFYEELRDHPQAGKAMALRQAQLALIKGDAYSHPIYWAPFLLIGDWL
jgi:CHAT domain-containing protein